MRLYVLHLPRDPPSILIFLPLYLFSLFHPYCRSQFSIVCSNSLRRVSTEYKNIMNMSEDLRFLPISAKYE